MVNDTMDIKWLIYCFKMFIPAPSELTLSTCACMYIRVVGLTTYIFTYDIDAHTGLLEAPYTTKFRSG